MLTALTIHLFLVEKFFIAFLRVLQRAFWPKRFLLLITFILSYSESCFVVFCRFFFVPGQDPSARERSPPKPFPVAQSTLLFSSQVREESACLCLCCRSAKIGLLQTLRLVLPCAVRHSLSSFCREQSKKGMHDTQCINRLGLFIIRRRVALVLPSAFTSCVVNKIGKPRRSSPPG